MTTSPLSTQSLPPPLKVIFPYESIIPAVVCAIAIAGIALSIIGLKSISCGQINAMSRLGISPNASILGISTFNFILGLVVLISLTKRKIERECQQIKQKHVQELETITDRHNRLTQSKVKLQDVCASLRTTINGLQQEKEQLEQELSIKNAEYLQVQQTIQQKAAAEKAVKQLAYSETKLQKEVKDLGNIPEHLLMAKKELQGLEEKILHRETELANLEHDIRQRDYKTKWNQLLGRVSSLETALKRAEGEARQWHMMYMSKH